MVLIPISTRCRAGPSPNCQVTTIGTIPRALLKRNPRFMMRTAASIVHVPTERIRRHKYQERPRCQPQGRPSYRLSYPLRSQLQSHQNYPQQSLQNVQRHSSNVVMLPPSQKSTTPRARENRDAVSREIREIRAPVMLSRHTVSRTMKFSPLPAL